MILRLSPESSAEMHTVGFSLQGLCACSGFPNEGPLMLSCFGCFGFPS